MNTKDKVWWLGGAVLIAAIDPGPGGVKIGVDISEELFNKVAYGFWMEITFRDDKANFMYMVNMGP